MATDCDVDHGDGRTNTGGGLRMAAYDASDGRRVVIFGPMDGDFSKLRGLLAQLADGTTTMADLHDQSFVEAADGVRLTLVADERAIAGVRRLDKGGVDLPVDEFLRDMGRPGVQVGRCCRLNDGLPPIPVRFRWR